MRVDPTVCRNWFNGTNFELNVLAVRHSHFAYVMGDMSVKMFVFILRNMSPVRGNDIFCSATKLIIGFPGNFVSSCFFVKLITAPLYLMVENLEANITGVLRMLLINCSEPRVTRKETKCQPSDSWERYLIVVVFLKSLVLRLLEIPIIIYNSEAMWSKPSQHLIEIRSETWVAINRYCHNNPTNL